MKNLIEQISELKRLNEEIYNMAGEIRYQADSNLESACNLIRKISGDLQNIIGCSHDIVYFTNNSNENDLKITMNKLNRLAKK
jgi:hypothetical protein